MPRHSAERAPKAAANTNNAAINNLRKDAVDLIMTFRDPDATRSELSNHPRSHCGWFRSCSPKSRNSLRRSICPASVASSTATATVA